VSLHITVFYLHDVKVHSNVDHIHRQRLVNCIIYCVFGHKTWRVWYVNITSHGSVYNSDTRVVFKHTSNATQHYIRHVMHQEPDGAWCINHAPDGNWQIWLQQAFVHTVMETFM